MLCARKAVLNSIDGPDSAGQFPLNMTYRLVHLFDEKNDGLVGEKSFSWGSRFQLLSVPKKRGISTDIIGSSIMAYINAINKIVYEEAGQSTTPTYD